MNKPLDYYAESLSIVIQHDDSEGVTLSTLTIDYPKIDNATANSLQLDIIEAITGVVRGYAKAKASALKQTFPE